MRHQLFRRAPHTSFSMVRSIDTCDGQAIGQHSDILAMFPAIFQIEGYRRVGEAFATLAGSPD